MDRRALIRLRIAFLLLGAALLVPLGLLLRSVNARLEEQRRLRHELVAERIFDEMERELTGLLQRENARPSAAYADSGTRVENWAPFVVGYFTKDAGSAQIIAKPQLSPERIQRLEAALNITRQAHPAAVEGAPKKAPTRASSGVRALSPALELGSGAGLDVHSVEAVPSLAPASAAQREPARVPGSDARSKRVSPAPRADEAASSGQRFGADDVLKQLNRAKDEREKARAPVERDAPKGAAAAKPTADDPLSGY